MLLYTSKLIVLLLSVVTSSTKTNESISVATMHTQTITPPPPCFTDEWGALDLWNSFWPPELYGLFPVCLNCNLAILFLWLTTGLHLAVVKSSMDHSHGHIYTGLLKRISDLSFSQLLLEFHQLYWSSEYFFLNLKMASLMFIGTTMILVLTNTNFRHHRQSKA